MTTRHRRYVGRANRRRAQRVPLRSQKVAMTYVIDRGGPEVDRLGATLKGLVSLARPILERIAKDDAAGRRHPLIRNGRKHR